MIGMKMKDSFPLRRVGKDVDCGMWIVECGLWVLVRADPNFWVGSVDGIKRFEGKGWNGELND